MSTRKKTGKRSPERVYHEMTVNCFALDSIAQAPMVLLKDEDESNTLPIWFSSMEAVAIAAELINRDALAESGGEDLMARLFSHLHLEILRIAIEGMDGVVFDACIYFSCNNDEIRVKVRPCEAVVMALKHSMTIHVADEALSRASILEVGEEESFGADSAARFVDLLESLDPKDMGKYPM